MYNHFIMFLPFSQMEIQIDTFCGLGLQGNSPTIQMICEAVQLTRAKAEIFVTVNVKNLDIPDVQYQ